MGTSGAGPSAKLVYVTPAHQFPLGVTMSLRRRLALLEWARRSRTLIFEDDYDSEYRYQGRPIPALQGLDRAGVVIYAGTFNEVLFPALRLAYLVVPPGMVDRFAAAQAVSMRHAPLLDQAALCDFITEGHFARHIRRMRELYSERLAVFLEASRSRLGGLLEIPDIEAGLQTVGWLAPGIAADRAAEEAARREVEVIPLSRYSSRRFGRQGLLLGFAAVDARELRRGVEQLGRALETCPARSEDAMRSTESLAELCSASRAGRPRPHFAAYFFTNFANLRGSMAMNSARPRASTSPF